MNETGFGRVRTAGGLVLWHKVAAFPAARIGLGVLAVMVPVIVVENPGDLAGAGFLVIALGRGRVA